MSHAQKPDFVFRRKGRVNLNRWGRQFSRLLAAEVCASAVVILDTPCSEVVCRVLATHSFRQFPLHFPSRASPCVTVRHRAPSQFNWTLPHDCITATAHCLWTGRNPEISRKVCVMSSVCGHLFHFCLRSVSVFFCSVCILLLPCFCFVLSSLVLTLP